ncbi:MAG: N-acetylmuramoyl-L-alanine amidase family protein [Candidatus Cohnella colombiensis]|uniref:N-acetylmuramoyl-L-alanine amidase family protein n=1 Tax=Candidatus Cohnella colombiensis TaxID=3121368 RepID=A0AA95EYB3_9BACL|nr:MAG: N-acetylmuramoyl-L-alanine amidase family protein [Cohnella sp.]
MKKWLPWLIVVTVMLFASAGVANAEKATVTPRLILDGVELYPSAPPTLIEKTTMVPIRIITESLGYDVDFNNSNKEIKVTDGKKTIVMTLNQQTAYIDGQAKEMYKPATLAKDVNSALVPLRFVGEALGVNVSWDNVSKAVFMYSPVVVEPVPDPDQGNEQVLPEPDSGQTPDDGSSQASVGKVNEVFHDTDSIYIMYNGSVTPKTMVLSNPSRFVVDLPYMDFDERFSPALPVDPLVGKAGELSIEGGSNIQKVRYSLFSKQPSTIRFVLDLNENADYEVVNDTMFGALHIKLKQNDQQEQPQQPQQKPQYTVVLDAGHGGSDSGAVSIAKQLEKNINLAIVLKTQAILAKDSRIKLILTRQGDTFPTLKDRSDLANQSKADIFISVHSNSNDSAAINGTETYYTREDSAALANVMHPLFVKATGLKDNGVRTKNLHVTRETKMPAVLLEVGYLSNKADNSVLWGEAFQERVAQGIAAGIKQYLNL